MAPADKLYELIKDMPPNQISEVLSFAEFIKHKSAQKREPADHGSSRTRTQTSYPLRWTCS